MIRILERTISAIKNFDAVTYEPVPGEVDEDVILEHFEIEYEMEYKYSLLKNNQFTGVERRKQNIIGIIENKASDVIRFLAVTFEKVFEEWLDNHAITDPQKWAEQRFNEDGINDFGISGYISMFFAEWRRYDGEFFSFVERLEKHLRDGNLPDTKAILDDFIVEEGYEDYDTISFISNIGLEQLSIFYRELEFINSFEMVHESYLIGALQEWAQYLLFPKWYKFWKKEGIDETREKVEKVYNQIANISSYPLQKQFMILNIAKNVNHQNGSMLEYYEEMWGVGPVEMERLTDMDTTEWEEELREIGVEL